MAVPVQLRAVFIGALNMDQIVRVEHLPRPGETVSGGDLLRAPGGKGGNQAVAAARLRASVTMVGRVGRDAFGRELSRGLREAGVSTAGVRASDRPTGTALIFVDEHGENAIAVSPGANGTLRGEDVPRRAILDADVVVAALEVPLGSIQAAFRVAQLVGVRTVLNAAPAQALSREMLDLCDVVICNETELGTLVGHEVGVGSEVDAARSLILGRSWEKIVVVTLGERGALAVVGPQDVLEQSAFPVQVVDTVGAGDAFVAGFVVARWFATGVDTALRWGCAAGGLATTRHGAQPSMPALSDLERLLSQG
ncbi:MAG TPA: ribokinase [Chloroflexota bacterium]|jgi:ribokinase